MSDRYEFLKTTEHNGQIVALIADREHLGGEAGVSDLRKAFKAHAAPMIRTGVIPMTIGQLRERLPELKKQGLTNSAAAFTRAIEVVESKTAPTSRQRQPTLNRGFKSVFS